MPIRVGIDLVCADSVREALDGPGERYLDRIYSPREVSDCRTATSVDAERLAARFAAKEATLKVLRVGDEAVPWREIEVRRDPSGYVRLLLSGRAASLADAARITDLALSLSHDRGYATAVVIAELAIAVEEPQ